MKRQLLAAWAFLLAACLAAVSLLLWRPLAFAAWASASALAWTLARAWNRRDPLPMPASMQWLLRVPRGPQSPRWLAAILDVRAGERVLEIGPGPGVHALPIASMVGPRGRLDAVDVQREVGERLRARARRAEIWNLEVLAADARSLPYASRAFDAAYVVSVLGEVPSPEAALREFARVLKPEGRLVVGEFFVDPDFIPLPALVETARRAGFVLERTSGPRGAYFARFHARQEGPEGRVESLEA